MRVVDQRKIYTVDFDRVIVARAENVIMAESLNKDISWILGSYESEDRALEIFEQMHEAYSHDICNTVKYFNEEDLNDISKEMGTNPILVTDVRSESMMAIIDSRNDVFYMPQK